ncbi:hypothetical protein KVR01_007752 [Diaporthe batatas]|uniref:uncharacterized protein n=1 Tax=Diaporthe batatas TaxID=748121 RepID=UPI001D048CC0|nr:uncharacterized protein KVR01_007752 [Diaporthe batatas]KAG8161987.1 hypothetical protein KVR01_007752 [Diaporthe batatas]
MTPTARGTSTTPPPRPFVHGVQVSPTTQCAHWHSDLDIIAIKHKCCGQFYACISCHEALAGHTPQVWARQERHERAVLCGSCSRQLSVDEYLSSGSRCPGCGSAFNPGCARHYELYFEV